MNGFLSKRKITTNRWVFVVKCSECNDEHMPDEVKTENIEEDIQGRDVISFSCPVTNELTKSLVYRV